MSEESSRIHYDIELSGTFLLLKELFRKSYEFMRNEFIAEVKSVNFLLVRRDVNSLKNIH